MIRRVLATVLLTAALVVAPAAAAPPSALPAAAAHFGHYCGHGSHSWAVDGQGYTLYFDAHWEVNVGGSQTRHMHRYRFTSGGRFIRYEYVYCSY